MEPHCLSHCHPGFRKMGDSEVVRHAIFRHVRRAFAARQCGQVDVHGSGSQPEQYPAFGATASLAPAG